MVEGRDDSVWVQVPLVRVLESRFEMVFEEDASVVAVVAERVRPTRSGFSGSGRTPSHSSTVRTEKAEPRMLSKSRSAVIIKAKGSSLYTAMMTP